MSSSELDPMKLQYALDKVSSKEELDAWLRFYLKVELGPQAVSRFATSSPLDMVWDIYSFFLNEAVTEPRIAYFIAARSTQKTLSLAVLKVILPLHFGLSFTHFGGTLDQANRAYSYLRKFVKRPYIAPFVTGDPKLSTTTYELPDGTIAIVEIAPLTPSSVQGPHTPVLSVDELASLSPQKMGAYPDLAGIPVNSDSGHPWVQFGISTRKGRFTIIETEYENRHNTGVEFYFWTMFEGAKRCPDEISGTIPTTYYANVQENITKTPEEFDALPESKKTDYTKADAFDGCLNCPLRNVCLGDAKKQQSDSKYLRAIPDLIKTFKRAEYSWNLSQRMSMSPSAENLVYSSFSRDLFEKTVEEMHEIAFHEPAPPGLTPQGLAKKMLDHSFSCTIGNDHGSTAPETFVVCFEDSAENIYIMEVIAQSSLDPNETTDLALKIGQKYGVRTIVPDQSDPGKNKLLQKTAFFSVKTDYKKGIAEMITAIKMAIKPTDPGPHGTKMFGIKGQCNPLIDNFEKYRWATAPDGKTTDVPVDADNDCCDGLGYIALYRKWVKRSQMVFSYGEVQPNTAPGDMITKRDIERVQTITKDRGVSIKGVINEELGESVEPSTVVTKTGNIFKF